MNAATSVRMRWSVPSIACEACVAPVEEALAHIPGVDEIRVDVANKSVTHVYDLRALRERIAERIDEVGHVLGEGELEREPRTPPAQNAAAPTAPPTRRATAASKSPQVATSKPPAVKKDARPALGDVLMKHPAMKGLQATTMLLMIPMIPIMLSAIYVELARPFKRATLDRGVAGMSGTAGMSDMSEGM